MTAVLFVSGDGGKVDQLSAGKAKKPRCFKLTNAA